jgi:hypothetical protein
MINSFIEHAIKDGVDCILVKEEQLSEESYLETIKIFNSNIIQMEHNYDNKLKSQELSK